MITTDTSVTECPNCRTSVPKLSAGDEQRWERRICPACRCTYGIDRAWYRTSGSAEELLVVETVERGRAYLEGLTYTLESPRLESATLSYALGDAELRRWSDHTASRLHRPVLIIDEAQEVLLRAARQYFEYVCDLALVDAAAPDARKLEVF